VGQWCEDWYRSSMNEQAWLDKYPRLNDGGGRLYRVVRGASWISRGPEGLLSAIRANAAPTDRTAYYGFRCVLAPVPDAH
jgi:formylglycine-generating enzyme required for sulfatase activity